MGEKPLSIDEGPVRTATMGGVETPPPGMAAAGINTTRSNIKNAGGVFAPPPVDGGGGGPVDGTDGTDGTVPPEAGAAGIITTRSNIKHGPTSAAQGVAADGEPIPGIDTKGR